MQDTFYILQLQEQDQYISCHNNFNMIAKYLHVVHFLLFHLIFCLKMRRMLWFLIGNILFRLAAKIHEIELDRDGYNATVTSLPSCLTCKFVTLLPWSFVDFIIKFQSHIGKRNLAIVHSRAKIRTKRTNDYLFSISNHSQNSELNSEIYRFSWIL